ncbi:MAG: sensor histidine kinase, partial [Rubrivivax sp.]|nr:sensor histidine kinase [Rubrivivax sp.]
MKPSICNRLVGLLVASAVATSALVALAIGVSVRSEVDELLDETLQASAEVLGRLLAQGDATALRDAMDKPLAPGGEEHFAWQLVGRGGELLLRSPRAPAEPLLPLPTPGFADARSGWRVYGLVLPGGERVLYVAQTRSERLEAESEVARAAVLSALAVGVLAAAWLASRVRRELQPLADLTQALAAYEPLRPDSALPDARRRELQPMHDAIEALGRRLARRVANERAFSAHAAHALRTPLAGIEAQLAVAQREAPPQLQPRLARVREGS